MALNKCPEAFWDFAWMYTLDVRKFLVREASKGRPPKEIITHSPVDVSEYIDFDFYGWVKYLDEVKYPENPKKLGRWLGVAHKVGSPMTYWVLKDNGQVIPRSSVQPLTKDEWIDDEEKKARDAFDVTIKEKYGEYDPELIEVFDNDDMADPIFKNDLGPDDIQGTNMDDDDESHQEPKYGKHGFLEGASIMLPHGDRNEIAKVIGRKRDAEGNFIGRAHKNPILDSRIFTVRFPDGDEKDYRYQHSCRATFRTG